MATIRHGGAALTALYRTSVPIFTAIIRRAFGVAGGAFAEPDDGWGQRVAWDVASSCLADSWLIFIIYM